MEQRRHRPERRRRRLNSDAEELHVLQKFLLGYERLGFSKYFKVSYHDWYRGLPMLHLTAQAETWTMPDVKKGITLLHDELGNQNVGDFAAVFDLRCLTLPPTDVLLHVVGWMREHSEKFEWQLVAASLIIRRGVLGYVARAMITALTTAVHTTAKFNICFEEAPAKEFLQTTCGDVAAVASQSSPQSPSQGTEGEARRFKWSILRGCSLAGCMYVAFSYFAPGVPSAARASTCGAAILYAIHCALSTRASMAAGCAVDVDVRQEASAGQESDVQSSLAQPAEQQLASPPVPTALSVTLQASRDCWVESMCCAQSRRQS